MEEVIKTAKPYPDPQGTKTIMFCSEIFKNSTMYNLEILNHKVSNTILHFQYGRDAMGPLTKIKK